jgi:hypothetical protein
MVVLVHGQWFYGLALFQKAKSKELMKFYYCNTANADNFSFYDENFN